MPNSDESLKRLKAHYHAAIAELRKLDVAGIEDLLEQVERYAGELRRRIAALSTRISEAESALKGTKARMLADAAEHERQKQELERKHGALRQHSSELDRQEDQLRVVNQQLAGWRTCGCPCGCQFFLPLKDFADGGKVHCPRCGKVGTLRRSDAEHPANVSVPSFPT